MNAPIVSSSHLTVTVSDGVAMVRITSRQLTEELNIEQIGLDLFALPDRHGINKVVMSFADVEMISSSMLGKLISLHRKVHRSGGKLILCEIQPLLNQVFHSSRLSEYFRFATDPADAASQWA